MARCAPVATLAVVLGATVVLGIPAPAAAQRAAQTAMSVPRPVLEGAVAGLPQPLAPSDAARLRRIFELQSRGEASAAAREAARLTDARLLGHVLADRWLREGSDQPGSAELQEWLARYADHPDAPAIHALLVRVSPRGAALPPAPPELGLTDETEVVPEEREPPTRAVRRNPALERQVQDRAARGDVKGALARITSTRGMTPAYAALLKAEIALVLFRQGKDEEAFRIASEAARAGEQTGRAGLAAGLGAWGIGRYDLALPYFESAARSDGAAAALRSAAAFWTARAAVRARRPQTYVPWMTQAAQEPRTFYGQVARRSLGLAPNFGWERDMVGEAEGAALAEIAGGWRALALLQIGQKDRAEAELRRLWPLAQPNAVLTQAMLVVASQAGMAELAAQFASLSQTADGRPRDFARFPLPRFVPQGGFRVDPALLYGLARQESNFNPAAISPAGARGLMQIMPATASYVTRDPSLAGAGVRRLHDPAFSLDIGQRYLHHLARLDTVDGDLIRVLAAYNAGPGNLARWLPAHGHREDPFLFIEAIPLDETRSFVQRVLAYSWIYASRLGVPARSLDELAAGAFPRFPDGAPAALVLEDTPRRTASR